jgi:hypothetical protein
MPRTNYIFEWSIVRRKKKNGNLWKLFDDKEKEERIKREREREKKSIIKIENMDIFNIEKALHSAGVLKLS